MITTKPPYSMLMIINLIWCITSLLFSPLHQFPQRSRHIMHLSDYVYKIQQLSGLCAYVCAIIKVDCILQRLQLQGLPLVGH